MSYTILRQTSRGPIISLSWLSSGGKPPFKNALPRTSPWTAKHVGILGPRPTFAHFLKPSHSGRGTFELNEHASQVVQDINSVAQQARHIDPKGVRRPYVDPTIYALIQLRRAVRKALVRNQGADDAPANRRLTALAASLTTGHLVELAKDSRTFDWEHLF
eukprot:3947649-Pyramimonas_sp.AAC.1